MNTKHTPKPVDLLFLPWSIPSNDEDPATIRNMAGDCVAGPGVRHVHRIVQCVNGCEGIDDPSQIAEARKILVKCCGEGRMPTVEEVRFIRRALGG